MGWRWRIRNQQTDLQLSARCSLSFCSILPALEQQQPPRQNSQPITCSRQLIFLSAMALPPPPPPLLLPPTFSESLLVPSSLLSFCSVSSFLLFFTCSFISVTLKCSSAFTHVNVFLRLLHGSKHSQQTVIYICI